MRCVHGTTDIRCQIIKLQKFIIRTQFCSILTTKNAKTTGLQQALLRFLLNLLKKIRTYFQT